MAKQLDNKVAVFQGNAYPAMIDSLAQHLGVSAESLKTLGVGWAPVVHFSKGRNSRGWWTIPERDSDGEPVGLSLRSRNDDKCMYPGSSHGLTYPLNPNHDRNAVRYQHGAHNWVRLADAGVDCPVCDKPDGCLVSSEDPDDPKAAICIREDSDKPMKFGHLHVLKDEGNVQASGALAPSGEDPVIVVEGMTDVAAAMDLGMIAVGRPSAKAGLGALKELVRDRHVIVLGENDANGAGQEGMVAAFQMLKTSTKSIYQALPPQQYKDLRTWVNGGGLTRDELVQWAHEHGQEEQELTILPNGDSLTMAEEYLNSYHRLNGRHILRYDRGRWLRWDGIKYREVDEASQIRGPVYRWAKGKSYLATNAKGEEVPKPISCHRGTVNNVMDAMLDPCPVPDHEAPCWMNGVEGPDPSDLIPFQNGVLHVSRYMNRSTRATPEDYMLEPTPDLFNLHAVPYAFDPTARCLTWKKFVKDIFQGDYDKIALLQEWLGLCLTPMTKFQKMMIMRGPAGSGKSTILNIISKMVGKGQSVSPSFTDLTSDFGLADLIGAQVALMDEAKVPNRNDAMQALEVVLKITGEGTFNIRRKFLGALKDYKFAMKFTLATNELPNLPDHAQAMLRRLLILDFPVSFRGYEDWDLESKLEEEIPGIIVWALEGYQRLIQNQQFTIPEDMKYSLDEWRTSTSPTAGFIEECCEEDQDATISKHEIYDAWSAWSAERGMRKISKSRFLERLKANSQYITTETHMHGGEKHSVVRGLRLTKWAERRLLDKPV